MSLPDYLPRTGAQLLPFGVEDNYLPAMRNASMVGVLSENIDWVTKAVQNSNPNLTKVYYMAHNGNIGWDLWRKTLSNLPPEDAVTEWWDRAGRKRQGVKLDDLLNQASNNGHRLVVGGFGEPEQDLLNNLGELEKFAQFEKARQERLWAQGGMASVFKFSVGTLTQERVDAIAVALDNCRWHGDQEPISVFCIDEYGYWWPSTWMGPNQTDHLIFEEDDDNPDAKWAAITQDLHPDFANLAVWRPAWLVGRVWGYGHRDEDGQFTGEYGFSELFDVLMMLGEFGVDHIGHWSLPWRREGQPNAEPFNGWWTCRGTWQSRLGYPNEQTALKAALLWGDDFYTRFRLPNGDLQVPWRMWFGLGPGHHWTDYDLARSSHTGRMYREEYLPDRPPLPEGIYLAGQDDDPPDDDPPPDVDPPDDPPPPEPPKPGVVERVLGLFLDESFCRSAFEVGTKTVGAVLDVDPDLVKQVWKKALT